jgi:hypothetical protein
MITRRIAPRSGGVRPDGDRPAPAVSASRSRSPIGRSDDDIASWGRCVILHLCATSRPWSGPADRAAWTVVTQSSLSCRGDSRQPALPAPPCEPDLAVIFPGADDVVGLARAVANGSAAAETTRALTESGPRSARWVGPARPGADSGRGGHPAHPTLEATRPVGRIRLPELTDSSGLSSRPWRATTHRSNLGFGSASTCSAMLKRRRATAGAAT